MAKRFKKTQQSYLDFYDDSFRDTMAEDLLPIELRTINFSNFSWEKGYVINMYRESEVIELLQSKYISNNEVSKTKKSAYLLESVINDNIYHLRDGEFWLGEHLK